MRRALALAEKGRGYVSPNPMVGAVIVKDGHIVGEGYHQRYGEAHAEINAIRDAHDNTRDATLYITLEPCAHHGQTPPCVDAVINAGFRRVVVATADPNPKTNGRSISRMMDCGIQVDLGVMEEEARRQNEVFFKYITTEMPFVILKAAQTLDGRISDGSGQLKWITGEESLRFVHELRAGADAIVIGARTAIMDNPQLTVRHIEGPDPFRIVLQDNSDLPEHLFIFDKNDDNRTIIATPENEREYRAHAQNAIIWSIDAYENGMLNLAKLLMRAGKERITSILVEGGSMVFSSFLKHKFVDKIYFAIAPKILGTGIPTCVDLGISEVEHSIRLDHVDYFRKGEDIWVSGYPIWR